MFELRIYPGLSCVNRILTQKNKKTAESSAVFVRSSYGNRTHDSAVRGQRLSLLTNEPYLPAELCVPKRLCFMSRASKILL